MTAIKRMAREDMTFGQHEGGDKLAAWRKTAGLTQAELARLMGRSRAWLARFETQSFSDLVPPDGRECRVISEALGVGVDEVMRTFALPRLRKLDPELAKWVEAQEHVVAAELRASAAEARADALTAELADIKARLRALVEPS
jgi:transcriptional regulator with XRE-family HTH domain